MADRLQGKVAILTGATFGLAIDPAGRTQDELPGAG